MKQPGKDLGFATYESTLMKQPDKDLAFAINAGLQAIAARRAQAEHASHCLRERTRRRRANDRDGSVHDCRRVVRGSDPFYA